jgi:hypothetical protein
VIQTKIVEIPCGPNIWQHSYLMPLIRPFIQGYYAHYDTSKPNLQGVRDISRDTAKEG